MAAENLLNDTTIRKTKAETKLIKLNDGGGLRLDVMPEGGKWWRWRYRFAGKEKMLSLGVYPDVPLAEARSKRNEARALLKGGTDPSAARKARKAAVVQQQVVATIIATGAPMPGTFEAIARDYLVIRRDEWAPKYFKKIEARLVNDVFPYIGATPAGDVTPPDLLKLLRRIESRGAIETAHRVRDTISLVFRHGIAEGTATSDPARDVAGALKRHTTTNIAAIIDPAGFGQLLRAIDSYRGTPQVRAALKLLALVFTRPGSELREAQWSEFDLDEGVWTVPAARMKRRLEGKANGIGHIAPLAAQAVDILRELYPLTGSGAFVFPGIRHRHEPMSENTINAALDAMGFDGSMHRAHGFRASARTMLRERLKFDKDVIEEQLAHAKSDPLKGAYDRAQYLDERRPMMQAWADYLDGLRNGAQVLEFKAA